MTVSPLTNPDTIKALILSAKHWDRNCESWEGNNANSCALCRRFRRHAFTNCIEEGGEQCPMIMAEGHCYDVHHMYKKTGKGNHTANKALADKLWSLVPDEFQNERVKLD